jgi:hypothetical protein
MGLENDNGTTTRSCKDCLWGDKCRDMEHKSFSLADIPCEDYWTIDEDAEVDRIIELERVEFMERWNEYEKDWEWDD